MKSRTATMNRVWMVCLIAFILLWILIPIYGCGTGKSPVGSGNINISSEIIQESGCKEYIAIDPFIPPPWRTCIKYIYDGKSILYLTHINYTANCCEHEFTVDVSCENGIIKIIEGELLENPCRCICQYDVDMSISGLPPGEYTISVDELYFSDENDDKLEFTVDLSKATSGMFCVGQQDIIFGLE